MPNSYEGFLKSITSEHPEIVVILSHHHTLKRDAILAGRLRNDTTMLVVAHPLEIAELAYEKRLMSNKISEMNSKVTIPELSFYEAKKLVSQGSLVISKQPNGTEGIGFCVFFNSSKNMQIEKKVKSGHILQKFIPGIEYSINVHKFGDTVGVMEPVEKGATNINGLHPSKRIRTCPPICLSVEAKLRLSATAENIAHHLNLVGVAELEFIVNNDKPYFLEINPRISATMRMNCLACDISLFKELARVALKRESGKKLIQYPACRFSYERPVESISDAVRELLLKIDGTSVSSRLTLSADTKSSLEKKIVSAENVLSKA